MFYETSYSLYVTIQASRRAWRIIQSEPCKTFYPYYTDSMEARAVALIGRKQRAAKLLYGDNDIGLSELTDGGDEANDLIAELAKSLDADAGVTDLRDLFKAASSAESNRESLWAVEAAEDHPESQSFVIERWLTETQTWQIISRHVNGSIPVNLFASSTEAEQMAQQLAVQTPHCYRVMGYPDPQGHFIHYQGSERQIVQQTARVSLPAYDTLEQCTIELGGTLESPMIMVDPPSAPAVLPPKPKVQRRRRVSLSAAPDDLAALLHSTKSNMPQLPRHDPTPAGEVRQLALFDV